METALAKLKYAKKFAKGTFVKTLTTNHWLDGASLPVGTIGKVVRRDADILYVTFNGSTVRTVVAETVVKSF